MTPARAKAIQEALQNASSEYRGAAQEEMGDRYGGSVDTIYRLMRESYSIEGKARNLSRRWGIDSCNCA